MWTKLVLRGGTALLGSAVFAVLVALAWGPLLSGGTVAFVGSERGRRDLFLVEAASGLVHRLTTVSSLGGYFAWAGNGESLVFTALGNHYRQLYRVNADGSALQQMTGATTNNEQPVWSPQGDRLAFVYDVSTDASQTEVAVFEPTSQTFRNLSQHPTDDHSPAWSPDGSSLVFVSHRDNPLVAARTGLVDTLKTALYIIDVDAAVTRPRGTTTARPLTEADAYYRDPAWSPDGTAIAFAADRTGTNDLYLLRPDEGTRTRLTDHPADDVDPVWSPDGTRIAFTSFRDGNADLFVLTLADGTLTRLTRHPARDSAPSWSKSGAWIAFESSRAGASQIYIVSAFGGRPRRLTWGDIGGFHPLWQQ